MVLMSEEIFVEVLDIVFWELDWSLIFVECMYRKGVCEGFVVLVVIVLDFRF